MSFPLSGPPQWLSQEEFRKRHEVLLPTVPRLVVRKKKFHGVKLSELDDLEKLYEVNIQVYSLAPTQNHSEDEENEENSAKFAATLIRR